ncbi:hypothetical protein K2X83_01370 [Patescibacteria group bacterium]|nr:hypothetical protein [Patescibacteria group bacterium]
MKIGRIIELGFLHAFGAVGYVALVALTFAYVETIGPQEDSFSLMLPMGFLLLFSASVGVMASIVFLRPALWYLEGQKREALILFASTIGFLAFGAFALVLGTVAFFPR